MVPRICNQLWRQMGSSCFINGGRFREFRTPSIPRSKSIGSWNTEKGQIIETLSMSMGSTTSLTCCTEPFIWRISSASAEQSQSGVESSLEQILEMQIGADLKVLEEPSEKYRLSRKNPSPWLIFRDYHQLRETEC